MVMMIEIDHPKVLQWLAQQRETGKSAKEIIESTLLDQLLELKHETLEEIVDSEISSEDMSYEELLAKVQQKYPFAGKFNSGRENLSEQAEIILREGLDKEDGWKLREE